MTEDQMQYLEQQLKYLEFWENLEAYVANDSQVQEYLESCNAVFDSYDLCMKGMTLQQQEIVSEYDFRYSRYKDALIIAAYEMGRAEGPRKEHETVRDWIKQDPDFWEAVVEFRKNE